MAVTISGSTGIDKVVDGSIATVDLANDAVTTDKLNLISTSSVPSLEARSDGTTDGYIQLNCSANSHGIKLKSPPHSAGASYTLTFPNNDGDANQFLQTNGSGVMSWAAPSGGGVSLLGTITTTSGATNSLASVNLSLHNKIYFNFDQVSPATGSSTLRISINGAATMDLGTAIAADRALFGELQLDVNSNVLNFSQSSPSGTPISTGNATDGANEKNFLYQVQTDLTALTSTTIAFTWSTGNAFDNGRILVYGLK